MQIHHKLRQLRLKHNLTQAEVAEYLGISTQTVSKWERGLLCPDIRYLPMLAVFYHTSIDSMFDMQSCWDEEHHARFLSHVNHLHQTGNKEGVYRAWIEEIELQPDRFSYYITLMVYVLQNGLFSDTHIKRLLQLAEYARRYCQEDDIRNEIYRLMLQITSHAQNTQLRHKAKDFYKLLPQIAHSREFFFDVVESDPKIRRAQITENLKRITGLVNHCILRLITPEMTQDEKINYHKKAVKVLEAVWEDMPIGLNHLPLLYNYYSIVLYSVQLRDICQANLFFEKLQENFQHHLLALSENEKERKEHLVSLKRLLNYMQTNPEFSSYETQIQILADCLKKGADHDKRRN